MMLNQFLSAVNYPAVLVAGVAYWIVGAIWYSLIFGNMWGREIEKHGVKLQPPTSGMMVSNLVRTLIFNLISAFGVSFCVFAIDSSSVMVAVKLGLLLGVCFSAVIRALRFNRADSSCRP